MCFELAATQEKVFQKGYNPKKKFFEQDVTIRKSISKRIETQEKVF